MTQSRIIEKINTANKIIALTFHDGPDGENIMDLLDILDSANIKCTFFLAGKAVEIFPDYSNMIVQRGHEIANHSFSHIKLNELNQDSIKSEIIKTEKAIVNILGVDPKPLFRSPYNIYNQNILDTAGNLGYLYSISPVLVSVDCPEISAENIVEEILRKVSPGTILSIHINRNNHLKEVLPEIINGIKSNGYNFATVSDLISIQQRAPRPELKSGNSGEAVRELQRSLDELGYELGEIDGIFGPLTENAVRTFQFDHGILVSGIVENKTWIAIETEQESLNKTDKCSCRDIIGKRIDKKIQNSNTTGKTVLNKIFSFFQGLK